MKVSFSLLLVNCCLNLFGQSFDFYGPEPFDEILDNSFNQPWTPEAITSIENRRYIVIMDESASNAVMLNTEDIYSLEFNPKDQVHGSSSTYGSMLSCIFQLEDLNAHQDKRVKPLAGKYKVNPFLHSYFSLNSDESGNAICSDAGTLQIAESEAQGFLLLEFEGTPDFATIKATGRWTYDQASDTLVDNSANWTTRWLQVDSGTLLWTSTEADASSFFLADATDLIDLEIEAGSDFNPLNIEYQPNATVGIDRDAIDSMEESKLLTELPKRVSDEAAAQFGTSADATAAASAMLDEIKTTLAESGSTMRYPKEFYLAIRESMLSQRVASSDIYGGLLDYNTISDVYFTNAADDSGVPHPFMVVVSFAVSTRPNLLLDVNRPPGAAGGPGYGESYVTRHGKTGDFVLKIPIKDYGLIENLEDNDLSPYGDLATDFDEDHNTQSERTVYNYAATASSGVAIDGVTIYPAMNNNIRFAVEDGEISHSGIHVGGGLELHYHADGHSYNRNGINLYNLSDYAGHDHPPIVGIAYDGVALFGKYEESYSSMIGYNAALDEYGGHDHGDDFGYHYHAHTETHEHSDGTAGTFTEHFLLVGAWKVIINSIPGFDQAKLNQFDETEIARYAGAEYVPNQGGVLGSFDDEVTVLYPNPTNGMARLKSDVPYRLFLYDFKGRVVWRGETIGGETILNFGQFKGVYLLKGVNSRSSFISKIAIK